MDVKSIKVYHNDDTYVIYFEFNNKHYNHIKEQKITYYLLQATGDEIEDIEKIRQVINNDDYYFIEHPTKYTSIIELLRNK
jgi:hypothetical protein